MNEQIYTNYLIQLPDQEVLGTLVVRDGKIADIQPGIVSCGLNGQGDYLMPGLIELHTDNLEKCMLPRPKVKWPLDAAAVYHDRDLASAGITTVCDAISIGDLTPNSIRSTQYDTMIHVVAERQEKGHFLVDHRLHLRCELTYDDLFRITENYVTHPLLCLISLMDHTPGQRQFVKLDKYRQYYMGKHGVTAEEMELFIQDRQQAQRKNSDKNRQILVELAHHHGIPLASHDDTTVEHVQQAVEEGVAIAEFPTTLEAAQTASYHGLQVLMGAPNLILGGSHSGNISALELVEQSLVDILSSDYVPQSLLQSIFLIAQTTGQPICKTMRLVTCNPAKAVALDGDRGTLEIGKRADLITVHQEGSIPRLTAVIREGKRIS
jgi:alpha-D-ribose 1-methylphosphonate 5-triphosphate diphosphatase